MEFSYFKAPNINTACVVYIWRLYIKWFKALLNEVQTYSYNNRKAVCLPVLASLENTEVFDRRKNELSGLTGNLSFHALMYIIASFDA